MRTFMLFLTFSVGLGCQTLEGIASTTQDEQSRLHTRELVEKGTSLQEAIGIYKTLIESNPNDCGLRLELVQAQEAAIEAHVADLRNKGIAISGPDYSRLREETLSELEMAVQSCPSDVPLRTKLAELYKTERNYDRAILVLKETLALDPMNTTNLVYLGLCQEYSGNYSEALNAYEKLVHLAPDDEAARGLYISMLSKLGLTNEWSEELEKYRKDFPVDADLKAERDERVARIRELSKNLGIDDLWEQASAHTKKQHYKEAIAILSKAKGQLLPLSEDRTWGDAAHELLWRTDVRIRMCSEKLSQSQN